MKTPMYANNGNARPESIARKRSLRGPRGTYICVLLALAFVLAPHYSSGQVSISPCPKGAVEPPAGLVAWWSLNEKAGATQVIDRSGNGNHGTPTPGKVGSTSPWGPAPVPGFVSGAMRFYFGTFAKVPNSASIDLGPSSFSIDAWIQGGSGPIVNKLWPQLAPTKGYSLTIASAGPKPTLRLQIGSKTVSWDGGPAIPSGAWYFVGVTVNRTKNPYDVRFYKGLPNVDFVQSSTTIPAGTAASGQPLEIGKCPGNPNGCISIDELEIFKRDLGYDELKKIFSAGPKGKCINPKLPDKNEIG